jgi:hypothetical protein
MALTLAVASTSFIPQLRADDTPGYTTISISGSTALKNFLNAPGDTWLTPGQTFTDTLGSWTAPNDNSTEFQLAPSSNDQPPVINSGKADLLRIEYHASGSVEGIQDLVQSQIGTGVNWVPTSGNPVFVNRNQFNAINASGPGGWALTQQNAVQMAVSDVNPIQGFSIAGTPSVTAAPGTAGYGQGNPALGGTQITNTQLANLTNASNIRPQLVDQNVLNMSSSKFGVGDWNTATFANLDATKVAVTATLYAANPGTGLTQINRTDAQWLQTNSRLQNGATFNFTSRDVNSGTRNVAANDAGVDPSFAVGKNDAGNGFLANATTTQVSLNPNGITFSNKTSGGAQLLPTLLVNRMSIGTIGLSDAIGNVSPSGSGGANPLVSLAYSDSTDGSTPYVQANFSSISSGSYAFWQNETYVTLKDPNGFNAANGTWASQTDAQTGILGDPTGAVAAYRQNVLYGAYNEGTLAGLNNPGDTLIANSFIPEEYMAVTKTVDGIGTSSPNPTYDATGNANINTFYGVNFATTNTATTGTGSIYGKNGKSVYITPTQGDILITNTNYLFGNFNQNGSRDLNAVETAVAAQAAYETAFGIGAAWNTGTNNNTSFSYTDVNGASHTITKGDAIVMGDTLSRGMFDGQDLYNLAQGAALSDASGAGFTSGQLTAASGANLGAQIDNGILRKNAAMDYLQANATTQQKTEAAVNPANPLSVANAFNKYDVNHDGVVNLYDAKIVKNFGGLNATSLTDQESAAITGSTSGLPGPSANRILSLYDAIFTDGHTIVDASLNPGSDLRQVQHQVLGDFNLDGVVNAQDINDFILALQNPTAWAAQFPDVSPSDDVLVGDFNYTGTFNAQDINPFISELQGNNVPAIEMAPLFALSASVPEPTTFGLLAVGGLLLARRSRRSRNA